MRFLDNINPFYKCVSVVMSCIMLSFTFSILLNCIIFFISIILLIFCSHCKLKNVLLYFIPVIVSALGLFLTGVFFGNNESTVYSVSIVANMNITSIYNGLQLSTRVIAFCSLGMLFTLTTKPLDFVHSLMQQGKLKPKFAYGVLASVNLMPNIKNEYKNARFALEVRGVQCNVFSFKPIFNMFVNAVFWADCLTMAMESKGFSIDAERIPYKKITVSCKDYLFLTLPTSLIILFMICCK